MTNAPRIDGLQKNLWINGSMDFFQRASISTNMTTGFAYSAPDRLKTRYQGTWTGTPTIAQDSSNVPANLQSLNACLISGNATNSASEFDMTTFIESFNARELVGGALSFGFQALTGAQSLTVTLSYASAVDNFSTVVAFNTQTIAIPANASYQQISFENISVPSQAVNGIQITLAFSNLAVTGSSSNHRFTQFMLNSGLSLSSYARAGGSYGGELALCQRYFEKSFPINTTPANGSVSFGISSPVAYYATGTAYFAQFVSYAVPKRTTTPTITPYSSNVGSGTWRLITSANSTTDQVPSFTTNTNQGFQPTIPSGGGVSYVFVQGNWAADCDF